MAAKIFILCERHQSYDRARYAKNFVGNSWNSNGLSDSKIVGNMKHFLKKFQILLSRSTYEIAYDVNETAKKQLQHIGDIGLKYGICWSKKVFGHWAYANALLFDLQIILKFWFLNAIFL